MFCDNKMPHRIEAHIAGYPYAIVLFNACSHVQSCLGRKHSATGNSNRMNSAAHGMPSNSLALIPLYVLLFRINCIRLKHGQFSRVIDGQTELSQSSINFARHSIRLFVSCRWIKSFHVGSIPLDNIIYLDNFLCLFCSWFVFFSFFFCLNYHH